MSSLVLRLHVLQARKHTPARRHGAHHRRALQCGCRRACRRSFWGFRCEHNVQPLLRGAGGRQRLGVPLVRPWNADFMGPAAELLGACCSVAGHMTTASGEASGTSATSSLYFAVLVADSASVRFHSLLRA